MKPLKKLMCTFFIASLPLTMALTSCGDGGGNSSGLDGYVYVNTESLNGGKLNARYDYSDNFQRFFYLRPDQYEKDINHLFNHYNVEYAYEMSPLTDDITKDGYVFGGWYLDKECSDGNYLTKKRFAQEKEKIPDKSVQIFASWLKPTERVLVYEVDNEIFKFKDSEKDKYKIVNDQITFRFDTADYDTPEKIKALEASRPIVEITEEGKNIDYNNNIFERWQLDFNGLRYEYEYKEFLPITNRYNDVGMEVPFHHFTYENFFEATTEKPYALLKPTYTPGMDPIYEVYFNENGGTWNPDYGKNCDRIIHKYTTTGKGLIDSTIYGGFVNQGISAVQRQYIAGVPKRIDYVPTLNDITNEGKVFAGWYLNKECTPDMYYCQKTHDEYVVPHIVETGYQYDLYARWIEPNERDVLFVDQDGIRRITYTSLDDPQLASNSLSEYVIDYNGVLIDYKTGELPFVPSTEAISEDPFSERKIKIEDKYFLPEAFSYENLLANGQLKPFMMVVKK